MCVSDGRKNSHVGTVTENRSRGSIAKAIVFGGFLKMTCKANSNGKTLKPDLVKSSENVCKNWCKRLE